MPTDKSLSNLIPFKPGKSGNPNGRPPSFRSMMKKLPRDAQGKAMDVLWTALQMSSYSAAAEYLKAKEAELPECGFMFQVVLRGLMGKDGAWVLGSILDRLFGRPRQQAEVKHTGNTGGVQVVVNDSATAAAVQTILQNAKAGTEPNRTKREPMKEDDEE